MKLLLVGYFPQNTSIYAYASSFINPLQFLGFDIKTFNYRHRYLAGNNKLSCAINHRLINHQLLQTANAFKPDVIFFIKAETITAKTVHALKKTTGALLINFYPDSPFALWNGNSTPAVLASLPLYDHFLIWSHELIPALTSAGCKQVSYFPFAFDSELYKQTIILSPPEEEHFNADVCFVGTWEPEREQWLTALCEKLPTVNVAIWGNEWKKNISPTSPLNAKIRGDAIYGTNMRKAFVSSKIVLNFIRQQNLQAHNMRTFEVPASNAFLLTQWTHDQASILFKEYESIACFTTLDDLIQKIAYYTSHEEERRAIIKQSFLRAQEFTLEKQLGLRFNQCIKNYQQN